MILSIKQGGFFMTLFQTLFHNLIGLDGIIICVALLNLCFIAVRLRQLSATIHNSLCKVVYLPLHQLTTLFETNLEQSIDIQALYTSHQKEEQWYQFFVSLTDILPLLGILGTVLSLLQLQLFETEAITLSFASALTSTFWGLVGAIICKIVEGSLSPRVEINRRNIDLLFKRGEQSSELHDA
jgi:chemotaxis protein MotA